MDFIIINSFKTTTLDSAQSWKRSRVWLWRWKWEQEALRAAHSSSVQSDKHSKRHSSFHWLWGKDSLSDVNDVKLLLDDLKDRQNDKLVLLYRDDYAHLDFIAAQNAKSVVYDPLIALWGLKLDFQNSFRDPLQIILCSSQEFLILVVLHLRFDFNSMFDSTLFFWHNR